MQQEIMICSRCIRRSLLFSPSHLIPKPTRSFRSISKAREPQGSTSTPNASYSTPISPAGTTIAQVLSKPKADAKAKGAPPEGSIAPEGFELTGLNYFHGKKDPVALKDSEYPEWLWRCLDEAEVKGAGDVVGDEFSKSKKQRRAAAKAQRKLEASLLASGNTEALQPKIPFQKQSIDLPSNEDNSLEGAMEAIKSRKELTVALRKDRRRKMAENNFLKSMK